MYYIKRITLVINTDIATGNIYASIIKSVKANLLALVSWQKCKTTFPLQNNHDALPS